MGWRRWLKETEEAAPQQAEVPAPLDMSVLDADLKELQTHASGFRAAFGVQLKQFKDDLYHRNRGVNHIYRAPL